MTFFLTMPLVLMLPIFASCQAINVQKKVSQVISKSQARIVIDPGHGGHDSGAISKSGLEEKKLTLDIALRLKRLINRIMPNVQVILTRHNDSSLSLEDRVKTANQAKADIFLSLHINSSEDKSANGFEIYSLDVASNRHAERLAARENVRFTSLEGQSRFILADLRANAFRSESDRLAYLVSKGLKHRFNKFFPAASIKDRGYNQAIFHVLFVNMPALLCELFFISNPEEERLLKSNKTREIAAQGIALGLKKYIDEHKLVTKNVQKK